MDDNIRLDIRENAGILRDFLETIIQRMNGWNAKNMNKKAINNKSNNNDDNNDK